MICQLPCVVDELLRGSQDSEDVVKAWESASATERVVQEVPLDDNEESDAAAESRLLRVLAAVPTDPPW